MRHPDRSRRSPVAARLAAAWSLAIALPLAAAAAAQPAAKPAKPPELPAGVGPADLSPAERAAVALAVSYLAEGPAAWQRRLAADSPWRALPAVGAEAEIAARVGPRDGRVRWMLMRPGPGAAEGAVALAVEHPSGMEEVLWLQLAEGDDWRLRELRTLSEPWPAAPADIPEYDRLTERHPGRVVVLPGPPGGPRAGRAGGAPAAAMVAATALLLVAAGAGLARRRAAAALPAAALALLATASCHGEGSGGAAGGIGASAAASSLGALAPLRAALAEGRTSEELQPLFAAVAGQGVAADVARLWRADLLLRQFRVNEAERVLTTFAAGSPYPLADLLRARLAIMRRDAAAALDAYEAVRAVGADHDGLRLEAAAVASALGFDEEADRIFGRLAALGSRLAAPYYAAAELAVVEERPDEGEAFFLAAWQLQPLTREELFSNPLLADLCARETVFASLDLGAMDEPRVAPRPAGLEPLTLPAGGAAAVSGDLLRVDLGDAELWVPGGGAMAPTGIAPEAPSELERRDRVAALAELATLGELAASPSVFGQPALRRRLELAATGLAEQERWPEIVELTAHLPAYEGRLPPLLTRLRAAALARGEQRRPAVDLLVRLARSDKDHGRRDAGALYQLADLLVREGEYDLAIRVLKRANAVSGRDGGAVRVRQVEMEQRLAAAHLSLETEHFRLRYPRVSGEGYARQVAWVLEEERRRLLRWIPVADPRPIDVDLYPVHEFLASYATALDVVGLFDGRVRVPFADLRSLHPELVSILSHEVAHAMITQATGDRAPRWLQEGLAQHVEMARQPTNPYPDLTEVRRTLSLTSVEQALAGFAHPELVGMSYAQAAWVVHYLEAEHGVRSIHRLLAALGAGADEAEALQEATKGGAAELDAGVRRWATSEAPRVWPASLRRYDREAEHAELRGVAPEQLAVAAANAPAAAVRPGAHPAPVTQAPQAGPATAPDMPTWHDGYAAGTRAAKGALGPVVGYYRSGGDGGGVETACRQLRVAVDGVLDQPALLAAPDRRVALALRNAFGELRQLAVACEAGRHDAARQHLERSQSYLGHAASVMSRYGLRP